MRNTLFVLTCLLLSGLALAQSAYPPFPLQASIVQTSNGYNVSNLTALGSFSISSPIELKVIDNYITPTYIGITVNNRSFQNIVLSNPVLVANDSADSVYLELTNITWGGQPTSKLSLNIVANVAPAPSTPIPIPIPSITSATQENYTTYATNMITSPPIINSTPTSSNQTNASFTTSSNDYASNPVNATPNTVAASSGIDTAPYFYYPLAKVPSPTNSVNTNKTIINSQKSLAPPFKLSSLLLYIIIAIIIIVIIIVCVILFTQRKEYYE